MNKKNKAGLYRFMIGFSVVCVLFLLIYLILNSILPDLIVLIERGDEKLIEEYISALGGIKGMLVAALLQFIQIISVFLPGAPIQIAIGIIFGTLKGLVVCQCGYLSAYALIFYSARRLGRKMDELFDSEKTKKGLGGLIASSSYPEMSVFIACLLPVIPNGLIPYMASKTKISFSRFMISSYAGSLPTLLMLCAIGNNLMDKDYLSAGIYTFILTLLIVYVLVRKKQVIAFIKNININIRRSMKHRKSEKQN